MADPTMKEHLADVVRFLENRIKERFPVPAAAANNEEYWCLIAELEEAKSAHQAAS